MAEVDYIQNKRWKVKLTEQKSKPALFSEDCKRKFLQLVENKPTPNKENYEKNPAAGMRKYLTGYKMLMVEKQTNREQEIMYFDTEWSEPFIAWLVFPLTPCVQKPTNSNTWEKSWKTSDFSVSTVFTPGSFIMNALSCSYCIYDGGEVGHVISPHAKSLKPLLDFISSIFPLLTLLETL